MRPEQWILFLLGVVLILVGSGLLTWVSVQKRGHAGLVKNSVDLLNAVANLFKSLGELLGPDPAAKAGGFLVVIGCGLIVGAFVI
jgi:hypothetical protein